MRGHTLSAVEGASMKRAGRPGVWSREAVQALASDCVTVTEIDGLLCAVVPLEICGGIVYRRIRPPLRFSGAKAHARHIRWIRFWGSQRHTPRVPFMWICYPPQKPVQNQESR